MDGGIVRFPDFFHLAEVGFPVGAFSYGKGMVGVHLPHKGKNDGIGIKGRTVMEFYIFPQLECPRELVCRGFPCGRQSRFQLIGPFFEPEKGFKYLVAGIDGFIVRDGGGIQPHGISAPTKDEYGP